MVRASGRLVDDPRTLPLTSGKHLSLAIEDCNICKENKILLTNQIFYMALFIGSHL